MVKTLLALFLATFFSLGQAQAEGIFGKNKVDDTFNVKSIEGSKATVEGTVKDLKVGDSLYFVKNPFKVTVTEVKGKEVTVQLPEGHELKNGMSLLRFPTEPIKKALDTVTKLKALEE